MTDNASQQNMIFVRELALLAWSRKRLVLCITAICAVLGLLTALLLPNSYTANTEILPPQKDKSVASMLTAQLGSVASSLAGGLGAKNPNDIYLGMLQSPATEDPIIEQFHLLSVYHLKLMSAARLKLEKHAEILSTKDGFVRISVEDHDSKRAAAIANAYVAQLRRVTASMALGEASQRRIFFEQQVDEARDQLSHAEQTMKDLQQKTGIIELSGQARLAIEQAAQLRGEISAQQIRLQSLLTYATENYSAVAILKQEIAGLQSQLAELEKKPGAGHGDVQLGTGELPEAGLEYVRSLRDVRYYEQMYELLGKQYELAKLDEAREGGLIQVLYPAVEPDKKSFPPRLLIVALFALLGFLGAIFWLSARELFREPVRADDGRA